MPLPAPCSWIPFTGRGALLVGVVVAAAVAALVVPNEVQMPGTQPGEIPPLDAPSGCLTCHANYATTVEPGFNWQGSMMANATRDPLFWATLAVAEQDFDGAGDFCLRCHTYAGWSAGRSTPTDGSTLTARDAEGVDCDTCHRITNPDNTEHRGAMRAPFIANDGQTPATGYYGSGMLSTWSGTQKLGPYSLNVPTHGTLQSRFHRSGDFCGSCHDVSNPAVGDLDGDPPGVPGAPLPDKAAFAKFPYEYGVVERTYSEYRAGALSRTLVRDYASLPEELRAGAIQAAFESSPGNYADGTPRTFTCQTCHLPAVTGKGARQPIAPTRADLPLHDLTGGNSWVPDAILYQNTRGLLRLGAPLTQFQIDALQAGKLRAIRQLKLAAAVTVRGNLLRVQNLTGHKLISGYPEGRRMWLNIQWYDAAGQLLREEGEYGPRSVRLDGRDLTVHTILDRNARVYEAHYGMTRDWAAKLLTLNYPANLPLVFDATDGSVQFTLGELANGPEPAVETFHFVLNNAVLKDNRIPPYGMDLAEAAKRRAVPVPATLYDGGARSHDEVQLAPPPGAATASIRLLYQTTSWEYIQFLYLANQRKNAFLANEGVHLLETWLNTGMAAPVVMATANWIASTAPPACSVPAVPAGIAVTEGRRAFTVTWTTSGSGPARGGYRVFVREDGAPRLLATLPASKRIYSDPRLTRTGARCYAVTAWEDCNSNGVFDPEIDVESAPSPEACVGGN